MKQNKQENQDPNTQIRLIQWLDDYGKHLSHRKSNPINYQQQISSLSKAYNLAQQKLLEVQKALLKQSIFNDKQRSIIQLLKEILNQNIDDDTILHFLVHLENDNQDIKHQLQLQQIKYIIDRKKIKNKDKIIEKQLKKEFCRVDKQRKQLMEDIQKLLNQNQQMEIKLQKYQQIHNSIKQQINQYQINIKSIALENQVLKKSIQELQSKNNQQNNTINCLNKKIEQYQLENKQIRTIMEFIQKKGQISNQNIYTKYSLGIELKNIFEKCQKQVEKINKKMIDYKNKIKQQNHTTRQLSLAKQFLSQQALKLFEQYSREKQECLERQILELARLERQKLIKLQQCQRKMWKYRARLIRQQQTINSPGGTIGKIYQEKDIETADFQI